MVQEIFNRQSYLVGVAIAKLREMLESQHYEALPPNTYDPFEFLVNNLQIPGVSEALETFVRFLGQKNPRFALDACLHIRFLDPSRLEQKLSKTLQSATVSLLRELLDAPHSLGILKSYFTEIREDSSFTAAHLSDEETNTLQQITALAFKASPHDTLAFLMSPKDNNWLRLNEKVTLSLIVGKYLLEENLQESKLWTEYLRYWSKHAEKEKRQKIISPTVLSAKTTQTLKTLALADPQRALDQARECIKLSVSYDDPLIGLGAAIALFEAESPLNAAMMQLDPPDRLGVYRRTFRYRESLSQEAQARRQAVINSCINDIEKEPLSPEAWWLNRLAIRIYQHAYKESRSVEHAQAILSFMSNKSIPLTSDDRRHANRWDALAEVMKSQNVDVFENALEWFLDFAPHVYYDKVTYVLWDIIKNPVDCHEGFKAEIISAWRAAIERQAETNLESALNTLNYYKNSRDMRASRWATDMQREIGHLLQKLEPQDHTVILTDFLTSFGDGEGPSIK